MKKYSIILFVIAIAVNLSLAQDNITLKGLWKDNSYYPKYVPGFKFQDDGVHFTKKNKNKIERYNLSTGQLDKTVFSANDFKNISGYSGQINAYEFSSDENKILIKTASEQIYRRSSKAYYYVYDRQSKSLTNVFPQDKQMYATFSPNGQHIAFVVKNNLYVKNLMSEEVKQITNDGKWNHIINGAADWVYEEEFDMSKAFKWSPKSDKIAFLRFDESEVREFIMMKYNDELYPEEYRFKYPKVGEKNAIVSSHVYDLKKNKTKKVKLPNEELYVPRLNWTVDGNDLIVTVLNRHQNHLRLFKANPKNGKTKVLLDEKNKYYINLHHNLTFLENGKEFIWTSEKDGFNHVYLYNMKGKQVRQLTKGAYDVSSFYGYDEKRNRIFYQAGKKSPLKRHIYSVGINGDGDKKLTGLDGWNTAQFSPTFDFFVNNHSTRNQASSYRVFDNEGKLVRDLELNEDLKKLQKNLAVNPVEFIKIPTEDNVELNAYIIKPSDFNPKKKYPLFMYLYGGPGSQQVTDRWGGQNYWWFQMLADKGFIVACVDNRGTGARGEEFAKMTYLQLGHYETIDQIKAAQYLGKKRFVDKERIGIFGWSYGGYMSSLCLLKGNDVFKMAIAVAPVTNWKWYDSIYTERYMRTVDENKKGYEDNSPIYFANQLKGDYLLMHGVADDNVHFQNSIEMSNALIISNKQFDTYYYPNNAHGMRGKNARLHLYTKMTDFILEKL